AIAQSTDGFVDIPVAGTGEKVKYAMQTRDPADFSGKALDGVKALLAEFGQSNRDQGEKSLASSMAQASALLNSALIKDRVKADGGRLTTVLKAGRLLRHDAI